MAINLLNQEVGATYKVKDYLGKQVVKGINYAIIAEQTIMSADKTKNDVLVIFNVWNDKITILSIEKIFKFNEETKSCELKSAPTIDIPKEILKEINSIANDSACTKKLSARGCSNGNGSWLSQISDNTAVNRLSIPGTHDTLTWEISNILYDLSFLMGLFGIAWLGIAAIFNARIKKFAQTQNANFNNQLDYGCRYFDIRIDGNLQGCHGIEYVGATCKYNLYDVMNDVKEFLKNYPNEFIVMRIKNDRDSVAREKINELIKNYENLFWKRSQNTNTETDNYWPLVKDVRGKIIVLDGVNDTPFFSHSGQYGFQYPPNEGNNLFYAPQDKYDAPDKDDKLALIKSNIDYNADSNKMKINHVSATGMTSNFVKGFFSRTPGEYADYLNPRVVDYLKSKQKCITGLLIFDYITDDIARVVISKNK